MQTPLAELIEWNNREILDAKHVIDNAKDYDERIVSIADHYYRAHYQVNKKATELLEKEREVIGAAYTAGGLDGVCVGIVKQNERAFSSEFDYFTKTFTDES